MLCAFYFLIDASEICAGKLNINLCISIVVCISESQSILLNDSITLALHMVNANIFVLSGKTGRIVLLTKLNHLQVSLQF